MSKIISANKLNRFWNNGVKPTVEKVKNTIKNRNDLMSNTESGKLVDALAVKETVDYLTSSLSNIVSENNLSSAPMKTSLLDVDMSDPLAAKNGVHKIETTDASTLTDSPVTSETFFAKWECIFHTTSGRAMVKITEMYPVPGRVWCNNHTISGGWSGWKSTKDQIDLKFVRDTPDSVTINGVTYNQKTDIVYITLPSYNGRKIDIGYPASITLGNDSGSLTGRLMYRYYISDDLKSEWYSVFTSNDVINNLSSTATDKPLSAAMGKALKDQIALLEFEYEDVTSTTIDGTTYKGNTGITLIRLPYNNNQRKIDIGYISTATDSSIWNKYIGKLLYRYHINDDNTSEWLSVISSENIVNNLSSTATNVPLSANMGKYLNDNKLRVSNMLDFSNKTIADFVTAVCDSPGMSIACKARLSAELSPSGSVSYYRILAMAQGPYNNGANDPGICIFAMSDYYAQNNYPDSFVGTINYKGSAFKIKWERTMRYGDVVNNLTSTATNLPLSANQGKILNDKANKVNVYVGSDGKLHFVNAGGTDTALNFNRGSGEAFRFINEVGYGRTDKVPGFANGYIIGLDQSINLAINLTSAIATHGLGKYITSTGTEEPCNAAIPQGAYGGNVSGYKFDQCISQSNVSWPGDGIYRTTLTGIKRGTTIYTACFKDSTTWYSRYIVIMVV